MTTIVSDYRALLKGLYWYPIPSSDQPVVATPQPVVLTYSFATTAGAATGTAAATFQPFSAADAAVARSELQQWAQVSGVTFLETTASEGDISFGFYNLATMGYGGSVGLGNYPSSGAYLTGDGTPEVYDNEQTTAGDIYVDLSYRDAPDPPADLAHVLIHEIGHALGLKHPFDSGAYTLQPALDTGSNTVMSYSGARLAVPGPLDVAAVQSIYGIHGATPAAWTWSWDAADEIYTVHSMGDGQFVRGVGARSDVVYAPGLHDAVVTAQGDDVIYVSGQALSINAGAGNDIVYTGLSYAGLASGVQGSGDYRYTYMGSSLQEYSNVETLVFSDGVYSTASDRFAPLQPLDVEAYDSALAEGNGPFVFYLMRTDSTVASRLLNWAVVGSGTAPAEAADFAGGVLPSGQVSFAAGQWQQAVTVALNNDLLVEADEQFTLQLSDPTTGAAEGSAVATIVDDDASLDIAATSLVHAEGDRGSTPFVFSITRLGDTAGSASVGWAVTGLAPDAADAGDFAGTALPGGTVGFAAGQSVANVTIAVRGDRLVEPDERFRVTLADPSAGLSVAGGALDFTILNDDTSVSIAATDASKAEGRIGATPFVFTVTRSGVLTGASSATWQVIGGLSDSANPADFVGGVAPSGTVSFAAGETSQTITVNVAGDAVAEADEQFRVVLGRPVGTTVATLSATATILNDDTSLAIAATDATKAEGNSGATPFVFTVTRSGVLTGTSSATWHVVGGVSNSANPADFVGGVAPSGTVSFAAGETSQTITVNVAGDTLVEADEQFQVVLGRPVGTSVTTIGATATIISDDTTLAIAATDATKAEGSAGATPFVFTVTRGGGLSGVSSARWQVVGAQPNSANPADFVGGRAPSGTVSFAAGESSQTITVEVAGDTAVEADEHFRVVLGAAVGAQITTVGATATILNDDGVPSALRGSLAAVGGGDFNGDGTADVLRQAPGGDLFVLDGASGVQSPVSQSAAGLSFVAAADFDGDGRSDLLLQGSQPQGSGGELYDWTMSGASVLRSDLVTLLGDGQTVAGTDDYTGDGRADILLANAGSGSWTLLAMHGGTVAGSTNLASLPDGWQVG
jgi:hypothetical protein